MASQPHSRTGQGSNSVYLRHYNERVILMALRRLGQASKADLARYAGLTDNTAGVIVRDLEARKLIRAEGRRTGQRGQPATLLTLDAAGAQSIGAKVGRRTVDVLLVDFRGQIVQSRQLDRPFPSPEEAIAFITESAVELRAAAEMAGWPMPPTGIGVALPSNLESWHRQLDIPEGAMAGWDEVDLGAELSRALNLPVTLENDGTAATVAELLQGRGRQADNFLYLYVGAAIGGGVVVDGSYHRGPTGNAGDIGLMPVPASTLDSAPQPANGVDVLLTRTSINALIRHLRHHGVAEAEQRDLSLAAAKYPELVEAWMADAADAAATPILSAARILDVPLVVLDGDLPKDLLATLIARIEARLQDISPESRPPPQVLAGLVGRNAAAIGAALLPLNDTFSPSHQVLLGEPQTPRSRVPAGRIGP
ncbi:MAG: ROK family protein [Rhodospirillaceae bacterium]|nr:ROK family protein [Rhodospirillaceae bacterium]